MAVIFREEDHSYTSIDENLEKDNITWTSVTTLVGKFKPKFDPVAQSKKSCKNKKSKWFGLTPEKVREIWNNETQRAIGLGNWYHNQREDGILDFKTIEREGVEVPIVRPIMDANGVKIAPDQKMEDGVYPEHFAYLKSAGVCGQADLVTVVNGKINILDYKTNKEIKDKGYTNWKGVTSKMYSPVAHLDDCNLNHYNLQLSIYMYIMLKHNPKLKAGDLIIQHVSFEKECDDEYGYPVAKYNDQGEPIIKEIKMYNLPYLKDEVRKLMVWLRENN